MLNFRYLRLEPESTQSLRDQVCELVSTAIAQDLFPHAEPLPSCRELAAHLGVSRNTVHNAYCRLIDIGLVTAKDRSGYFVDRTVAEQRSNTAISEGQTRTAPSPLPRLPAGRVLPSDMPKVDHPVDWRAYPHPFVYNQIEPARFPLPEWRESMRIAMSTSNLDVWCQDSAGTGSARLVKQLQQRLLGYRGVSSSYARILVTSGAQNAIYLLGALCAYLGRRVAIEDPCYPEARNAFAAAGCELVSVPVDADGLIVDQIPSDIGMVYTTPSHQCPTTVTMTRSRREALCARAARDDFLICEDDYEAEMNFVKARGQPIRAIDPSDRTIYVGSLSKSVAPGLRIGYFVAHPDIVRETKAIRRSMMRHPPILLQEAMAHFISSGALDAHLRRMERRYRSRWQTTRAALAEFMPEFAVQASQGGTCFWLTGPEGLNSTRLAQRLKARGVLIDEGALFFSNPDCGRRNFRIGFAALPMAAIREGIKIIAQEARRADG